MITCCVSAAFTTLQLICEMTRDGISADRVPLGYGNRSLDTMARYFNRAMLQLPRGLIHVPCIRSYILFILCNKNFIKIIFVFPLVYKNILTMKKVLPKIVLILKVTMTCTKKGLARETILSLVACTPIDTTSYSTLNLYSLLFIGLLQKTVQALMMMMKLRVG